MAANKFTMILTIKRYEWIAAKEWYGYDDMKG